MNNSCIFSTKKFEQHGNEFLLTEVFKLDNCKTKHTYMKMFYSGYKCEVIESRDDV